MQDYRDSLDLTKLVGAPPGLIGHDRPGPIFHYAESNPRGIIVLDNIDKAHPEVQDFFLNIFERGKARDARGQEISFKGHVFILTMTLNSPDYEIIPPKISQEDFKHSYLSHIFSDRFLDRIDNFIRFDALVMDDYETLFEHQFSALAARVDRDFNTALEIDEVSSLNIILRLADHDEGARGFLRLYEREIKVPVLQKIYREDDLDKIKIGWMDNRVVISSVTSSEINKEK